MSAPRKRKPYTPRRVEILSPAGSYMKRGSFGYVIGENRLPRSRGGGRFDVFAQDVGDHRGREFLVSKKKEHGGAVWYSPAGVRFTSPSGKRRKHRG